ncbi:hypothetical protein Poli38472_001121 [Pythium oligandrum]|uniref:NADH:flavin oxidoreductase/NADH oxidase N-terminal domain-containing protein n=1 Tax=Pythium oligandrum TaxID=41045 RepID=A0A8K1CSW0_PYTOL|nr:hypothetical protein Poli38472_001121 [Pythium oligandrum]|eukprot:TMW68965.1 hypothetical protein Poli38472_001121 [Pythium oligandrum]
MVYSDPELKLLTPLKLGDDLELKNRVIFGPLTRARSNIDTRAASEINEEYYEMRAGAGLIIAEATSISEQAHGWYGAPGCYTEEHAAAWKRVVDRVHARGGKIFLQLWHMGRQAHSTFNAQHDLVSASAIRLTTGRTRNANGEYTTHEVPRALETEEVAGIVEDYRKAAALAKKAGFDGIELHSANSYLIDQFMQSCTNKRTDKYGGSFENRARFLLEIIEAVKTVFPPHRIGARLAPNSSFGDMGSEDNFEMFSYVLQRLNEHKIGYVSLLDGVGTGFHDKGRLMTLLDAKMHFKGNIFGCNNYTKEIAEGAIRTGAADAVCFGRAFITNPDLPERFANNWPLAEPAPTEVYWNADFKAKGYLTYFKYEPTKVAS